MADCRSSVGKKLNWPLFYSSFLPNCFTSLSTLGEDLSLAKSPNCSLTLSQISLSVFGPCVEGSMLQWFL